MWEHSVLTATNPKLPREVQPERMIITRATPVQDGVGSGGCGTTCVHGVSLGACANGAQGINVIMDVSVENSNFIPEFKKLLIPFHN